MIWVFNNLTERNFNPKTSQNPHQFRNHQFLLHHHSLILLFLRQQWRNGRRTTTQQPTNERWRGGGGSGGGGSTTVRPSETDSKVILMGHEIVKLLWPLLVYSKGFSSWFLWSCSNLRNVIFFMLTKSNCSCGNLCITMILSTALCVPSSFHINPVCRHP